MYDSLCQPSEHRGKVSRYALVPQAIRYGLLLTLASSDSSMLQVHVLNVSACFPNGPTGDILKPHTSLQPLLGLVDEATRRDVEKFRFLRDARCAFLPSFLTSTTPRLTRPVPVGCMLGRLLARYVLSMRLDLPWQSFSFEKSENGRPYAVRLHLKNYIEILIKTHIA